MAITTLRVCACCKKDLLCSDFHKTAKGKGGLHSYCKSCRAIKAKERNSTNEGRARQRRNMLKWREKTPIYRQRQYTRKRFNQEPEVILAYVSSYVRANGSICASCGKQCDVVGGVKTAGNRRLVLDHCHKTGKLRGMICDLCNTALGKLGDNAEGVRQLLSYILRSQ